MPPSCQHTSQAISKSSGGCGAGGGILSGSWLSGSTGAIGIVLEALLGADGRAAMGVGAGVGVGVGAGSGLTVRPDSDCGAGIGVGMFIGADTADDCEYDG